MISDASNEQVVDTQTFSDVSQCGLVIKCCFAVFYSALMQWIRLPNTAREAMKWWKQTDVVAMLDQLVNSARLEAVLGWFSCSSGAFRGCAPKCVAVCIWLIDVTGGSTYWILIMNVLAKQSELHTHLASPRNCVSHHLTNVCPVFNCFPAPLEKTREGFWCAWRLESHLCWLAVSHGDGAFSGSLERAFVVRHKGEMLGLNQQTKTWGVDSQSI